VGAGLTAALLDRQWLRRARNGRGVAVTETGARGLREAFKIRVSELDMAGSVRS
jgi:hypothetical protein